ncbi:sensor domain-containing diguanylate cyclase [Massilia pseudoviolaceinigra]|uniref:sensor domain-containing diguanylate cyclase n=1 Tax=Massilia pseudoviolaceinigra TaxID=3057165 RepID=UPI0027969985|nr:PAS domain S-box protein [Massilia sp. CCM 9206]MDQ1923051.1 PAS domain S-box protein [Massilia sp. CCM 9206]
MDIDLAFSDDTWRVRAPCMPDSGQEERFDRLTRLTAIAMAVPIALVSLVDEERQWFKSRVGLDATETARSIAFCSHAVAEREMLVVEDALQDPRFHADPLVTGALAIRFYAGQPVFSHDGEAVGTLCIIDTVPRQFDDAARQSLRDFASLVEDELNKGTLIAARVSAEGALQALNIELEKRIDERTASLSDANDTLKREIRQRLSAEATLRANEERIRTIISSSFSAFISTDANGMVVDWNPSAERTFGWTREEALGRELATLIVPESYRAAHRAGMQRFTRHGAGSMVNTHIEMPACTRDHGDITVEMTINAFEAGGETFFGAFLHDVSGRIKAKLALMQKQQLLDSVLETLDVGVVACSADGELTLFNRAAREFHGLPPQALPSGDWASHYSLFSADGTRLLEERDVPLVRALNGETVRDCAMLIAPKGLHQRCVLASGRRMIGPNGEALGAVVAMKDITELSESQRKLKLNEQRLRAITENLPALVGQVDKAGNFTFLNSQALRFYGRENAQLIGQPVRQAYSAPEFEKVEQFIKLAMQGKRVSFEDEITVEGRRSYYHASYIPDIDAGGSVNGFYAMAFDITARKRSEIRQHDSEERLRTVTDNLPALISYLDIDLRYRFANAMYKQWYGVDPADMVGKSITDVFPAQFRGQREQQLRRCLEGHTVQLELEVEHGGESRILHSVYIPHMRDGVVLGAYLLSTDVTAARRHEANLKALANTDTLTGLPNRRSYEAELEAALARSVRNGTGIALMYLDIDRFKQINDTLGHAWGDEVLREFARRLLGAVRTTDTVSRLAGDEFTIILESVHSSEECAKVGAKIVETMRPLFSVGAMARQVSASIGIAWTGSAQPDARELAREADAALYQAKAAGCNQYCLGTKQA